MYQDIFKEMMHYALLSQPRDGMEGNKWSSITRKSNYVRKQLTLLKKTFAATLKKNKPEKKESLHQNM